MHVSMIQGYILELGGLNNSFRELNHSVIYTLPNVNGDYKLDKQYC